MDEDGAGGEGPEDTPQAPDTRRRHRRDPRVESGRGRLVERVRTAENVPSAVRGQLTRPPSQPTTLEGRAEAQLMEMLTMGPAETAPAIRYLLGLGPAVLPVIVRHFPGAPWVGRGLAARRLPAGRDVSPIAAALVEFGQAAIPHVAELLHSGRSDARLYAALVARDLASPELIPSLGQLLLTDEDDLRRVVACALDATPSHTERARLRISLSAAALGTTFDPSLRVRSIRALGELGDGVAMPALVELLEGTDEAIAEAAHDSLAQLTARAFGVRAVDRWVAWSQRNRRRHRIEWLLDAMDDREPSVRERAAEQLLRATGQDLGYDPHGDPASRQEAAQRYRDWWERQDKHLPSPVASTGTLRQSMPTPPGLSRRSEHMATQRLRAVSAGTTEVAAGQGERRRHPRVQLGTEVTFKEGPHAFVGVAEDVSEGGIFVATYDLRPVGSRVDVVLHLDSGETLETRALVRWHRPSSHTLPPGMGVEFEALAPRQHEALVRLLDAASGAP